MNDGFSGKYILDGRTPVPCDEPVRWAYWLEHNSLDVARVMVGEIQVSTIFMGLDHNATGDGPPLLFETRIFGGLRDGYLEMCSTWEQAEAQQVTAVKLARGGLH